jgi:hypothetical protein
MKKEKNTKPNHVLTELSKPETKKVEYEVKVIELKKDVVPYVFTERKIVILSANKRHQIWFSKIISMVKSKTVSNSVEFTCVGGILIVVEGSLENFKEILNNPDFIETKSNSIANMLHAITFEDNRNTGILHLTEKKSVEVSKENFKKIVSFFDYGATIIEITKVKGVKKGI